MMRYILTSLIALSATLSAHEDYSKIATLYAQNQASGTDYLAFRDIPDIIAHCAPKRNKLSVLDYGCGAGLSTRFIKQVLPSPTQVVGVDLSTDMLQQAMKADPQGKYLKMEKVIPFPDSSFDLVYCNFVLFEIPSHAEIIHMLSEIRRTMKDDAPLIATTGTPEMYNRKNHWASLDANFPENDHLKSGDIAKVTLLLPEGNITFGDYYWTEQDYRECFEAAGFTHLATYYPLGQKNENLSWQWKDETTVAPYVIFVASR